MKKLLLIGPRSNKKDVKDTGGVTILFELLLKELERKNIEFTVIDTLRENYKNLIHMFFVIVFQLLKQTHQHEQLSFHATKNSFIIFAPLAIVMAKAFSKKISVRKFAGNFNTVYQNGSFFKKFFIRFVLKNSDFVFFETKYLLKYFKFYNSNTFWFPNVRDPSIINRSSRQYRKRFVYIGTVNKEKGIDDICAIYKDLGESFVFDIYGPIKERHYSSDKFKGLGINYKGVLEPDEVLDVMNQYDVLVLPSYREGYPGVIIEAFALGMPVIATKLEGVMEMCEDNINAKLIEVGNPKQLLETIVNMNEDEYQRIHQSAMASFDNFNSERQTVLFLKRINLLEEK
jgi:glycosyltransferase involved in cell wall biosynthesis